MYMPSPDTYSEKTWQDPKTTPLASPWAPHKQEAKANMELQAAWQSIQSAQLRTNLQSAEEVFCYYFFNVRGLRKCHWLTTEKSGTRILVITHDKKQSLKKNLEKPIKNGQLQPLKNNSKL